LAVSIRENDKTVAAGIGFLTGIMILVSGFELIPEAQASLGLASTASIVGFGAMTLWLANFAIPHIHLMPEHGLTGGALV
jgi:zinc transporter ZupT